MTKTMICRACELPKPLDEFAYRDTITQVRVHICRGCQSELSKKHYRDNKKIYNERRCQHTREYRERNRGLVLEYLLEHPCVDCGESDPVVLQFDHIRGVKLSAVAKLAATGAPVDRLMAEINKCTVRCANCHMRVTARRHGAWYKSGQRA